MPTNLILTGGHTHRFDVAAPALASLLGESGIESRVTDDIEAGLATLAESGPDLLTVYALRWSMATGDKYAPQRARWAFTLSADGRASIESHLARGGGLLALHTALICFDDWPAWKDILGGVWRWGRSSHPPYGEVQVRFDGTDHPVVRGLNAFDLRDEAYGNLDLHADVRPLMHARAATGDWQPALWTREMGRGRVAVDTLGHDAGAFDHPVHRRIVTRAALWALDRGDAEIGRA
jgi:type 1 glutamine amidotransferase